jgi:hypothetical protein
MRRWKGWIALGVLALLVGAILIAHPWREPAIPAASKYSSASDLARDLTEHGMGCADPTTTRLMKSLYRYMAIWVDPRFLPDTLLCSVGGRPVYLSVFPPPSLKFFISSQTTPRYSNLEDAMAHGGDAMESLGMDPMLVGPNWMVTARHERDSIPALSAIRVEIGGTLVVAASPSTQESPWMSSGPSI